MINRLLQSKFIQSSFIFSATNFVVSVIGYAINLLIARALSLGDYGEYMTAMSYIMLTSVPITTFGLMITQRIGSEPLKKRADIALQLETWLLNELRRFAPLLLMTAVAFSLVVFFKGKLSIPAISFILVITFLTPFQAFYSATLQASKKFLLAGLLLIIIFLGKLLSSVGVIILAANVVNIFIALSVSTALGLVFGKYVLLNQTSKKKSSVKATKFDNVFSYLNRKPLLITLFTTLGVVGLGTIDLILVKKFLPAAEVGLYSSIALLSRIIVYVATPLSQVAFTFFTGADSKHTSPKILVFLTIAYIIIGSGALAAYTIFPELIVTIIFGEKFLSISNLIWIAALLGTLYSVVALYAQYLISKQSWWGLVMVAGVIAQTGLLYFYHQSFQQIITISISVMLGLVVILGSRIGFGIIRNR